MGACKSPASRPDAAGSTGGAGGAAATGGTAGAGSTGGAAATAGTGGAVSTGTGVAGTGSAGSGGASTGGAAGDGPIDAGDDSQPGVPDATDARVLEPIHVTEGRMDAAAYHDLRFVGVGLDQYEGDVVTFRIGSASGPWRTGSGQVRIVQGAFDVLFPQVLASIYEQKHAHIDADGNGRCDADEPIFLDSGLADRDITLTVTPNETRLRAATAAQCDALFAQPTF